MLKGAILIGNHNLSDRRTVRITPTPLDEVFYLYNIFICMDNKKYIDKVLDHLVKGTKIDYENQNLVSPFLSLFIYTSPSSPFFPYSPFLSFSKYCKNTFGLTEDEIKYVWNEYKKIIVEKIEDGE